LSLIHITKSLRPLGFSLLFLLTSLCLLGSSLDGDLDEGFIKKLIDYTGSFESRFYDFRAKKISHNSNSDVILVKIDDYSLDKINSWPIPRENYLKLMSVLENFGVKVVAFDVLFPENSQKLDIDNDFAKKLKSFEKNGKRVFLAYTLASSSEATLDEVPVELLTDALLTKSYGGKDIILSKIAKFTFPLETLYKEEIGFGHITTFEDSDGIFRKYKLVANIDSIYLGSLGLNVVESYLNKKHLIQVNPDGSAEIQTEHSKIELNRYGEMKIRYLGSENKFPSISFYDLISAKADDPELKKILKDKIVFIGSTAVGAHDLRPSPVDPKMPGVFSHMNLVNMFLKNFFFKPSNESLIISFAFFLLFTLLFLTIQKQQNAIIDLLFLVGYQASIWMADYLYFLKNGYEIKLFYLIIGSISLYAWSTFLNFYEANKEKKYIKGAFSRYVSPNVVDQMLQNPDLLHMGGEKKNITCLFSDVRDFTSISENLSPQELSYALNYYMTQMTNLIFETHGTLDKYIGDAIVAIWGAPLPDLDHPQHAVETSIKMIQMIPEINHHFQSKGIPDFKIGIGINSGECSVGNMGSEKIFSYTALGDNMNLGARLEGLCKVYQCQILISESTRISLKGIKTRYIDQVIVKGKTQPVTIHEVLTPDHPFYQDDKCALYEKMVERYLSFDFASVIKLAHELSMEDFPTKRILHRAQELIQQPNLSINDLITEMKEK